MFSRTKRPFFLTDPQEACEGLLPQIILKRAMKQISCHTRGEGPHRVCTVHPRRTADETGVENRGKKLDILCHLERRLGSAGIVKWVYKPVDA